MLHARCRASPLSTVDIKRSRSRSGARLACSFFGSARGSWRGATTWARSRVELQERRISPPLSFRRCGFRHARKSGTLGTGAGGKVCRGGTLTQAASQKIASTNFLAGLGPLGCVSKIDGRDLRFDVRQGIAASPNLTAAVEGPDSGHESRLGGSAFIIISRTLDSGMTVLSPAVSRFVIWNQVFLHYRRRPSLMHPPHVPTKAPYANQCN